MRSALQRRQTRVEKPARARDGGAAAANHRDDQSRERLGLENFSRQRRATEPESLGEFSSDGDRSLRVGAAVNRLRGRGSFFPLGTGWLPEIAELALFDGAIL